MKFAKHPSLLLLSLLGVAQSELKDQCGDCWCIYDGELAACPADPTGIVDSFDDSNVILRTFELTNDPDFLKLQTADGQECYPFADSVGPINRYPKSNLPQCAMPVSTDETVCAYLYGAEETCSGRSYQVLTYDSAAAAVEAGAVVTHKDACGVCSSAQDLWIRMKTYDTLESDSIACSTSYTLTANADVRFGNLKMCYTDMGYTDACATLWAHSAATGASKCIDFCFPDATLGYTVLNGPPPACEAEDCLTCTNVFYTDFEVISGRTLQNSGISERIARACSVFYPVEHDACVGSTERGVVVTEAPTPGPGDTAGAIMTSQEVVVMALLVLVSTVGVLMGA